MHGSVFAFSDFPPLPPKKRKVANLGKDWAHLTRKQGDPFVRVDPLKPYQILTSTSIEIYRIRWRTPEEWGDGGDAGNIIQQSI